MQLTDLERLVSTLGLPVSLLLVIGLTIRSLLKWFRPHAEQIVAAHTKLLDTCSATLEKNTENIDELTKHTIDPHGPCQRTVAALGHAAQSLEALGGDNADAKRHAQDMRRTLEW